MTGWQAWSREALIRRGEAAEPDALRAILAKSDDAALQRVLPAIARTDSSFELSENELERIAGLGPEAIPVMLMPRVSALAWGASRHRRSPLNPAEHLLTHDPELAATWSAVTTDPGGHVELLADLSPWLAARHGRRSVLDLIAPLLDQPAEAPDRRRRPGAGFHAALGMARLLVDRDPSLRMACNAALMRGTFEPAHKAVAAWWERHGHTIDGENDDAAWLAITVTRADSSGRRSHAGLVLCEPRRGFSRARPETHKLVTYTGRVLLIIGPLPPGSHDFEFWLAPFTRSNFPTRTIDFAPGELVELDTDLDELTRGSTRSDARH